MPYTTASMATAETMIKNFSDLSKEIAQLSKDKSKKDKVKTLEKDLDTKGKKIEEQLLKILEITRKEFGKHALNVENLLTDSVKMYQEMETGMKTFEKNPDHDLWMKLREMPRKIEANAAEADNDNQAFGKSWAELRGTNFTSQGLSEKYNAKFYKARFELMGDAKNVVGKIDQIHKLGRQATVLSNELAALFTGGEQDKKAYEEDAAEMSLKVSKLHQHYSDKTRDVGQVGRMRNALTQSPKDADSLLGKVRSFFQDMAAMNKQIKSEQSTLDKELTQLIKFGKNPTEQAKKALEEAAKQLKDFPQFAQAAADLAKEWAELFKEGSALVKKH